VGKNQMEREKREKIGIRMNKMLGEIRNDFYVCFLAKNQANGRFEKLLQ
jgi:hypothetical protein